MQPRTRQRHSVNVSNSRWMAYAVAGLATASGGAISAEGAIHYSGLINFKFDSKLSETQSFPLSQGAVLVGFRSEVGFYEHNDFFAIQGAAVSNKLGVYPPFYSNVAKPLPRGAVISQGYFGRRSLAFLQDYSCYFPGWDLPGTHAIGFRFNTGAGMQYGWVRIKWGGCVPGDLKFIVKDYAWADPGEPISAGQTSSGAAAPDEGSLGLLALGASGLAAWRKSRRVN